MCNCFEEMQEKVKAHIQERPSIVKESVKVRFKNISYSMPEFKEVVGLPLKVSYRKLKSSGEPYKNESHDEVIFKPSYCQFCGEELGGSNE